MLVLLLFTLPTWVWHAAKLTKTQRNQILQVFERGRSAKSITPKQKDPIYILARLERFKIEMSKQRKLEWEIINGEIH